MTALGLRVPWPLLMAALVCALGTGVYTANRALEARVRAALPAGDVGPLPDGHAVRVLSLGFDRLLADLFWLRAIYYVGDDSSAAAGYPAVDRLAELVTDIDPYFETAYVVMSGALGGLKGDPDAAIALLEKGVQHVSFWRLHFLLGFNYFMERQEYARAARALERAYELGAQDGAPPYLPLLAARLYANGGEPETAFAFVEARLRDERDEATRRALEKRYWDLWITRDLRRIDAAIADHRRRVQREPLRIEELVASGALAAEPRDPRGGPYRIEAGRATTDLSYDRLELYRPPRFGRAGRERESGSAVPRQEVQP
jgi:tetratricopeptide (TPR) repeat protein